MDATTYGSEPAAITLVKIIEQQPDSEKVRKKVGQILCEFDGAIAALRDVKNRHKARSLFVIVFSHYVQRVCDVFGATEIETYLLNVMVGRRRNQWEQWFDSKLD